MIQSLRKLWANQLIRGTTVFFVGSMVVNFGSFLYHLIMSRELGPVEYGILGSLFGLVYLTSIPTAAIDIVITKTVSEFSNSQRLSQSKSLLLYLYKRFNKLFWLSVPLAVICSWPIREYLRLDHISSVILVWIMVYISFLAAILISVLKGLLEFLPIVVNQTITIFLRVGIAVCLVYFFMAGHMGAQVGVIISSFLGLLLLLWQLRPVFRAKIIQPATTFRLRELGLNSFFLSAVFTSMYSLDIIMVKHYLPAFDAGIYAVLATAGKIVLFASAPIFTAILPVVARKSKKPETARSDLYLIIFLIGSIAFGTILLYYLFPKFIITLIFTEKFLAATPYLALIGLAMGFYSLANALSYFLISIGQITIYKFGLAAVIAEVVLIYLFHTNLMSIIITLISVFGILAGSLLVYSFHVTRKKRFYLDSDTGLSRTADN